MLRTHTCGELNKSHLNQEVTLSGWVNSYRNLGSLLFIDLRDRYGITQAFYDLTQSKDKVLLKLLSDIKKEWVIQVTGKVVARPQETINLQLKTGEIELEVTALQILNKSLTLPFELNEDKAQVAGEALRFKYRYLDLRRPKLQEMLRIKDEFIFSIRNYMRSLDFWEIQTPILANSSPEGARDFLIPSRVYPGKFYALPQAPQQFKQLLMVGGVDKYFQIAPCFRDEDPRLDRHYGEFYQLDMEMSFVEQADILSVMEPLMKELTANFSNKTIINLDKNGHFPQISWHEAMENYGSDRPDLRFDLPLITLNHLFINSDFKAFQDTHIKAIRVKGGAKFSRKDIDKYNDLAKSKGAPGLFHIIYEASATTASKSQSKAVGTTASLVAHSSLEKFFSQDTLIAVAQELQAQAGDLVFILAGSWRQTCEIMGAVRNLVADDLGLKDNNLAAFVWVVDFPMYEYSELEEGKIDFAHNPFSMPQGGLDSLKNKDPLEITAQQFDLVLNGFEISSGAIRNHDPEIMYKAFAVVGYSKAEVDQEFGAMISAFSYGAPPHGGNAPGIDRILMILQDWNSIRDIYAFPKDGKGKDLMTGAPQAPKQEQLEELNISVTKIDKMEIDDTEK